LYQTPGFGSTTDFEGIKRGYNLDKTRNPFHILPLGPDTALWNARHDRGRFAALPQEAKEAS
jgi:putative glutathione S-transferase